MKQRIRKAQSLAKIWIDGLSKLKGVVSHPRSFSNWLEPHSPHLARGLIGYTSEIFDSNAIGMGLRVLDWTDDGLELLLPIRWKNSHQGDGEIHRGALVSAAEFGYRLFWERHLVDPSSTIFISKIFCRIFEPLNSELRLLFEVSATERQIILFQVQSTGVTETSTEIAIHNPQGRRVASVEVVSELKGTQALNVGRDDAGH